MTTQSKPSPEQILKARADNPKMRERDFAQSLGISEADFVAAHCGQDATAPISARRVRADVETLLNRIGAVGEIMALTRNESVVHEKIGPFEKTIWGRMLRWHSARRSIFVFSRSIGFTVSRFPSRMAKQRAAACSSSTPRARRSSRFICVRLPMLKPTKRSSAICCWTISLQSLKPARLRQRGRRPTYRFSISTHSVNVGALSPMCTSSLAC